MQVIICWVMKADLWHSGFLEARLCLSPERLCKEIQVKKDDINKAIFALDAGIGLDILFLFVELNYEYSLSQFWTEASNEAKQHGFIINAGIHIDF